MFLDVRVKLCDRVCRFSSSFESHDHFFVPFFEAGMATEATYSPSVIIIRSGWMQSPHVHPAADVSGHKNEKKQSEGQVASFPVSPLQFLRRFSAPVFTSLASDVLERRDWNEVKGQGHRNNISLLHL